LVILLLIILPKILQKFLSSTYKRQNIVNVVKSTNNLTYKQALFKKTTTRKYAYFRAITPSNAVNDITIVAHVLEKENELVPNVAAGCSETVVEEDPLSKHII
jgi:hypothetical protein